MDKNTIAELVKVAIREITQTDKSMSFETRLFEDLDMDSTSIIEFLMALEDTIPNLYIEPEELRAEHFQTIATITDFILNHISSEVY